MVGGYNSTFLEFHSIHDAEGCKHSLSNVVLKHKKCICCSDQFFFFLSDNEISQGSHVPNYVQFLTAQHSYSKTAVKSNVGMTQINFCHSLQLAGSHDYRGLPPCIPSRAPGTSSLRETPLSGLHCPKRKSWTAFKNYFLNHEMLQMKSISFPLDSFNRC